MALIGDLDREAVRKSANKHEILIIRISNILKHIYFFKSARSHDSQYIGAKIRRYSKILKTYIGLNRLDPTIAMILGYQYSEKHKTYIGLDRLDPIIAMMLGYQYSKKHKTYISLDQLDPHDSHAIKYSKKNIYWSDKNKSM